MTVTGLVESVRREPDGDVHINLAVKNQSLLNSANRAYEDGDLVVEEICQGAITQADAVGPCRGVPHNMLIPIVGVEATVTGSYVLDQDHGWMEIHPMTSISIGAPPGAAGVGPQRHHHHVTIVPVDIDPVHHHRVHHIVTGAWCTADAVYNSYYNDWDVYVHSNQLDKTVIVTGGGYTKRWYTNSQGYADVYWDGKPSAPALVTVGAATCSA